MVPPGKKSTKPTRLTALLGRLTFLDAGQLTVRPLGLGRHFLGGLSWSRGLSGRRLLHLRNTLVDAHDALIQIIQERRDLSGLRSTRSATGLAIQSLHIRFRPRHRRLEPRQTPVHRT